MLVWFDLDGFKHYNDRFGHLAGDALLAHLGRRLDATVAGCGTAFRPGGDEFCALLVDPRGTFDAARTARIVDAALAALSVDGEGFSISASHGSVVIPAETQTPSGALRIADDRMYARKGQRRSSVGQQTHDVLLGVLREREPELHEHLREVGRLAVLVGRRLGLTDQQLDDLRRAAELHDVGKTAIPDAILNKPGPLVEHEWVLMRRQTVVGERILAAAPSLARVGGIVRASHERWDGDGYPDGIAGDAIPRGARIVSVCEAFNAMTTQRPYAGAVSPAAALAELRRGAGTQFDPEVVAAFDEVWEDRDEPLRAAGQMGGPGSADRVAGEVAAVAAAPAAA